MWSAAAYGEEHVYFLLPNVHHSSLPIYAIYGGRWYTELWMMQHFHAKLQ